MTERNPNANNLNLAPTNVWLLLIGGAFVLQFVFALVYFAVLSNRASYESLYFVFAASGIALLVTFLRNRSEVKSFCLDGLTLLFLVVAALGNGLLLVFAEPWLLGAAFVSLAFAFGAALRVTQGHRIYVGAMLPLTALLIPLFSFDTSINDWICKVSSKWSDGMLTVGRIRQFDGRIQIGEGDTAHFFTLDLSLDPFHGFPFLFAMAFFFVAIYNRRWFHSILLVASTLFWAIVANCVRIVGLAGAFQHLEIPIGESHLAFASTSIAILFLGAIWSTDQFLAFWLGPVDQDQLDTNSDSVRATGKFWNRHIASNPLGPARVSIRHVGTKLQTFAKGCCIASIALGAIGSARFLIMASVEEATIERVVRDDLAFDKDWQFIQFEKFHHSSTSDVAETQLIWKSYYEGLDCQFSLTQSSGRSTNPINEYLSAAWTQETPSSKIEVRKSPVLFRKNNHAKGQLRYKLLSQGTAKNWLGRFPFWSNDPAKSPFLNNHVYAKLFVQYFGSIDEELEAELEKKFADLVAVLEGLPNQN